MRQPTSWNDRALLYDEPFLTEFAIRDAADEKPRGKDDWDERVAQAIALEKKCVNTFSPLFSCPRSEQSGSTRFTFRSMHMEHGRILLSTVTDWKTHVTFDILAMPNLSQAGKGWRYLPSSTGCFIRPKWMAMLYFF